MPLRKIKDLEKVDRCISPEHNPPSHMVLEDGIYEYECPVCGRKQTFRVEKPSM